MSDVMMAGDEERLVIEYRHGESPLELTALTDSLAALAALYERHYRPDGEAAPKLYVTRLETGSVIAEVAPYAELFGQAMTMAGHSLTVMDLSGRIWAGLRAFIDPARRSAEGGALPDKEDTRQLEAFIKPLTGRQGAKLGVRRARFRKADGDRFIEAEFEFDEAEINRAAANMRRVLEDHAEPDSPAVKAYSEVMLFFESASRGPGKEKGRTRDYAVVPEVSKKPLPVYFRTGIDGSLKDVMVRSDQNPLTDATFVVDLYAQIVDDEPRGYIVTRLYPFASSDGEDGEPSA
jgi:hypothetical protein